MLPLWYDKNMWIIFVVVIVNVVTVNIIIWQTWSSTILVVSHDREFLNTIATDVIHLHSQHLDAYHGDYDTFVKTKTERLKNQQREYEAQKEYREHIQVSFCLLLSASNNSSEIAKSRTVLFLQ